ncbi:MAG: type II secretion system protein N [Pseudomonadota bacterium]
MAQIKEIKLALEELYAPIFLSERSRYAGIITFVAVVLLVAYAVVSTLCSWYGDFKAPQALPKDTHIASVNTEAQLITELPKQHLLGLAEGDDAFLPITSLQLRLTGILKDAGDKHSKVIIAEGEQPGKVYTVGDTLLSGIVINAINEDGIVLEHSGRLEKLPLMREALAFQDAPKTLWETN